MIFVLAAAQRLGLNIAKEKRPDVFRVAISESAIASVPNAIKFVLPAAKTGHWLITFTSPNPEAIDAEYLGRNHRFVSTMARFLMEEALDKER